MAAGGHEAAAQQAVLEQLGQPGGVTHVGLAPGQDLDVAGVDQQQLEAPLLEDVPDRLPVLAGRLHHDLGDALGGQPLGECLELAGERAERPDLLAPTAAVIGDPHTGHRRVVCSRTPTRHRPGRR